MAPDAAGSSPVIHPNLRSLALSLGASYGWQAMESCPPKREELKFRLKAEATVQMRGLVASGFSRKKTA